MLLIAAIDAEKDHDIVIANIPNAFTQMQLKHDEDKVVMCLRGPLALLLCNLALKVYKPYLQTDKNGQPMLYVCTLHALYGTMKVALLYY